MERLQRYTSWFVVFPPAYSIWKMNVMLKRFEVENFKGFQNKLIFDLEAREYPFNESLVVNGIVNKALIYGKNGIGKSTLGIALFDIVGHLTDKEKMSSMYLINYINLNLPDSGTVFSLMRMK